MKRKTLLAVDGLMNLALGVLLIVFPDQVIEALGIPPAVPAFYPSMLGAVLFGIGLALLVERSASPGGLGLAGAAAINLSGGMALAGWLLIGDLVLPQRGIVFLWVLAILLIGLSLIEFLTDDGGRTR